jgi:hypothetical protein
MRTLCVAVLLLWLALWAWHSPWQLPALQREAGLEELLAADAEQLSSVAPLREALPSAPAEPGPLPPPALLELAQLWIAGREYEAARAQAQLLATPGCLDTALARLTDPPVGQDELGAFAAVQLVAAALAREPGHLDQVLQSLARIAPPAQQDLVQALSQLRVGEEPLLNLQALPRLAQLWRAYPEQREPLDGLYAHLGETRASEEALRFFSEWSADPACDGELLSCAWNKLLESDRERWWPVLEAALEDPQTRPSQRSRLEALQQRWFKP